VGLTSVLITARDALAAQSYGIAVTGQNITNANTPGYVRREALLQTRIYGNETYGGVEVAGLRRSTDKFLEQRHLSSVGRSEASAARDGELAVLETVFNDLAGGGIGEALDRIDGSFQQLAVDPSDTIAREDILASLGEFVGRVNETGERLAQQRTDLLNNMQNVVLDLNQQADEIASLNGEIRLAQAQGQDAADLRDRRGQVLLEMSPIVNIQVVEHADGSILVQAAGATIVEGSESRDFTVELDANGDVMLTAARTDGTTSNVTGGLAGGKLAGLVEARDSDIAAVQSQLDEYVFDFATALNTQHQAGFSLDGQTGLDLFDLNLVGPPPAGAAQTITVSTDVQGQPIRIAAAASLATTPGSSANANLISLVFDQSNIFSGTRTASEGYSDLVGEVGLRRASSQRDSTLFEAMEAQFLELKESVSGVSLDEEMVALTRYQRAYQAAARVLSVADEMLEILLATAR